jgi:hypothetical protein
MTRLIAFLLCATALPVLAQQGNQGRPGAQFIDNWDLNGDGVVTVTEAEERRGDVFLSFDANEDGILDAEEYILFDEARDADMDAAAGQGQGAMRRLSDGLALARNDSNGDGVVSREEFIGNAAVWVAEIDVNVDGVVTSADFAPRQGGQPREDGMGQAGGMNGHGQGRGAGQPGAHFVENWDLDMDGRVTAAEATERRGDVFFSFDANEDGVLDAEEYALFDEARDADMQGQPGYAQASALRAADGMRLERNDTDGDGVVSREEFVGNAADWVASMDTDGDGVVTTADFERGRSMGTGNGQGRMQGSGQGFGQGQGGQGLNNGAGQGQGRGQGLGNAQP